MENQLATDNSQLATDNSQNIIPRFTRFDLGSYGSNNDSGVLSNSSLGELFEDGNMKSHKPVFLICESSHLRDYNRYISCAFPRNNCCLRCLTEQFIIQIECFFQEKRQQSRESDFWLNSLGITFHA